MTTEPVVDWSTDYDIFDPGYVADPVPVWDELRVAAQSRTPSAGVVRGFPPDTTMWSRSRTTSIILVP